MLKATIIGNLGGDPDEPRYTADGRPFVRFNMASTYRGRGQDGETQEKTEWVRVTVFGRQAEMVSQYLRKGSRIYVEGRLESRPWIDNQQQPRAGLEVLANDVQFVTNRADDEAAGLRAVDAPRAETAGAPAQPARAAGPRSQPPGDDSELEDLPF
jgi:single-strand DNA-binding protein